MTFHQFALIGHVLISAMIIGLVLLQRGKGADAGTAFGAGASGTVFGAKGSANFLSRTTAVPATLFFLSSLGLTYMGVQAPAVTSLMEEVVPVETGIGALPTLEKQAGDADGLPDLPPLDAGGDAAPTSEEAITENADQNPDQ
jgi:preprotein translocase subunit SecG